MFICETLTLLPAQAKPNCLIFLDNDTVVVGGESKEAQVCFCDICDSNVISFSYQIHSLIEKSLLKSWDAHQTRWE